MGGGWQVGAEGADGGWRWRSYAWLAHCCCFHRPRSSQVAYDPQATNYNARKLGWTAHTRNRRGARTTDPPTRGTATIICGSHGCAPMITGGSSISFPVSPRRHVLLSMLCSYANVGTAVAYLEPVGAARSDTARRVGTKLDMLWKSTSSQQCVADVGTTGAGTVTARARSARTALQPALCTLRPAPYALHTTPCALRLARYNLPWPSHP